MSRPLRLLVVLAIAAALVAGAVVLVGGDDRSPRAALAPGRDFIGLGAPGLIARPGAEVDRALGLMARVHAGLVRQTFHWAEIERAPGRYDFSLYDPFVRAAAEHGLRVLPVLFDPPPFRARHGRRRGTYPPRRPSSMAAFAVACVRRYGPAGSFWRAHPGVPRVPIRSWQVWNEPSLPVYWPPRPDPAAYARLLAVTGRAIHGADPGAAVVSAGLPQTRIGVPFARYANELYRAGAAGSFDVLAIHPYAHDVAGVVAAVEQARRLMDGHGDDSPIWVTEIGWASGGPPSAFTVGRRGQAERVGAMLRALSARRHVLGLRGVVYFGLRDAPVYPGGTDFWGLHTGLLSIGGAPKPAFSAFAQAARRIQAPQPVPGR